MKWRSVATVGAAAALSLSQVPGAGASSPTPITDCSSDSAPAAIAADFEAGGSYIFECGTTRSFVDFTSPITVDTDLTVTVATNEPVSLLGYTDSGRLMTIEGGTVSLSGLYIADFTQANAPLPPEVPTNGQDGTNGTNGMNGAAPGDNGTDGTAGGTGGPGPNGADGNANGPAQGGALLVDAGATVTLANDTFDSNEAYGQEGGGGGAGGFGGAGGSGGGDGTNAGASNGDGGNGGASGNGGAGGTGGTGGNARGGAIYNAGDLTITGTTFSSNSATGGPGGWGGNGGGVWPGSYGGVGCDDDVYEGTVSGSGGAGGAGGTAGNAGAGGNGGNADGGALYNEGTLTLGTGDSFTSNTAAAGRGGAGGNNQQSYTYSQSDAGGGSYGSGSGGGPAGPAGIWEYADHNGDGPPVHSGCGAGGAGGAAGGPGASEPGGSAGNAQAGAIYDSGTASATASVTFTSNTATGGTGGAGGAGGGGGSGGAGGNQPGNVQDEFNPNPFGASPGDNASPSAGADGSDGGNGGNADSGAFVSASKSLLGNAVCTSNGVAGGTGGTGGTGGGGGSAVYQSGQSNGASGTSGAAGSQGSSTNPQASCADELDVTVTDPAEPGDPPAKLNAVVPVTVTVSAPATNHDTVSAIDFTGGAPVLWSPQASATSTDDTNPGSAFSLTPGAQQQFTYHLTVAQLGTIGLTSSVSGTDPSGSVSASGQNSILTSTPLQVTVTTDPGTPIKLQDTVNGWVPKPVNAIVTVKNVGNTAISQVTLQKLLVITVAPGITVKVPEIPIDQPPDGPTPSQNLGTLTPGQSAQGTYALNVRGDGKYDLGAVANGLATGGGQVAGSGDEVIELDGPALIWKASLPNPNALIPAGNTFTVNITLQDNSYQKTLAIKPMHAMLTGNAQDGHVQLAGDAISDADSTSACDAGEAKQLDPRTNADMEAVIRTASSDPQLSGAGGSAGGTRAEITFVDPAGYVVNDDGTLGAALDPSQDEVIAPDSQDFIAHIDDHGFPAQPPKNWIDGTWYFSKGLLIGAGQALVGMIHGVFVDIPKLVLHGLLGLPHALLTYAQMEAELWNDVKDDPKLEAAYLTLVGNSVLLAYKEAPALEQQAQQAWTSVNAAVLAHYSQLWTQWYAGDWKAAVQTMGEESGDAATNLGLMLAPCVLAKMPAVVEGFNAARAAAFARVSEELTRFPEAIPWLKAISELDKVVPGYEFTNQQLLTFGGLTVKQSDFLRAYAEAHDYLIVARTRATEAVSLLKEGLAVLKPELIKIKTVSPMDIEFLGYSRNENALVVIRHDLPTENEVKALLRSKGFSPADGTWDAVLNRLEGRIKERKYFKELEQLDHRGDVTMKFNLAGNSMDPSALEATPTTYKFRLTAGSNGDQIPQFFVGGRWRGVTGDVDFLQITHADGTPLSVAQRSQVYRDFSSSSVGMLHGESATWTMPGGAFDFGAKVNEFTRAGTVIQFGPDGAARAVQFSKQASEFNNELDYYVQWKGGYVIPGRGPSAVP